jgi:hypothetical protein
MPPAWRDELAPSRLLGRPLLALIGDASLRTAYHDIFCRVRQQQRRRRLAYRCDTSAERRRYLLQVTPDLEGGLHFATRLVERHQRSPQPGWDDPGAFPTAAWDFCSQCNQVAFPPFGWYELEEISTLALFRDRGPARLQPTLCARCVADLRSYSAA